MNDECCEVCGGVMVWRCTNNITKESKWKCKDCGNIQIDSYEPNFNVLPKKEPKYYTYHNGRYQVMKRINGAYAYFGCFQSEELAKRFVARMKEVGWCSEVAADVKREVLCL